MPLYKFLHSLLNVLVLIANEMDLLKRGTDSRRNKCSNPETIKTFLRKHGSGNVSAMNDKLSFVFSAAVK
jgi:hypothetical protein